MTVAGMPAKHMTAVLRLSPTDRGKFLSTSRARAGGRQTCEPYRYGYGRFTRQCNCYWRHRLIKDNQALELAEDFASFYAGTPATSMKLSGPMSMQYVGLYRLTSQESGHT
jgi:hypothetical protein